MLQLDNVSKLYHVPHEVRAVDSVSLRVDVGEFVAIRGLSGCGKTNLLMITGGLLEPDSGDVQVSSQHPYKMSNEARAKFRAAQIGFVFQQFHLVPYLSILDNVLVPSLALQSSDARARATELVERFGLTSRAHHVPSQLSTGERQRVAMARALLNRPKLVLADEPTGNLDRENAIVILDSLRDFANSGGTVLLVTHDDEAAGYAKRILKMESGKLVQP